ncbi:MAG: hypothetical protein E7017_06575 [Alphaproteobacteria bacterium]|nr:hypothetical protein [Alphaproteobacteria bacterium]
MKIKFLIIVFTALMLFCSLPTKASEDSADYPFPEDFNFDDLPDIEPSVADTPDTKVVEEAIKPDDNSSDVVLPEENKQPSAKITEFEAPIMLPETKYTPATGTVLGVENKIVESSDEPIFIPKRPNIETEIDAFDKDKSLTETLKESDPEQPKKMLEGTWVEKLTTSNPLSLLNIDEEKDDKDKKESKLEELVKKSRNKDNDGKSNASVFDISGVMLRMNLKQVERTLENRGFRKVNARFEIPNFIKWRNEETCRTKGVVGYERLESCVINMAKKDGHQYMQYIKYVKYDSKEEIEVYFTSNFTENKVYKIVYKSTIANITGNSPKAVYIRNIKVYDFWKKINQKYGHPDNKTTVTWGMGGDKPYLKASTGNLLLEDPMFRELDYTRMSREDQRFINSEFYNF